MVGPAVALGTLMFVLTMTPLLALGFVGFVLAPVVAMWSGAAAASLVDSRRHLNTTLVIVATIVVYGMIISRLQSQPPPPGTSFGGPSVPAPRGGPTIPPP